jgi:hypothetical protein
VQSAPTAADPAPDAAPDTAPTARTWRFVRHYVEMVVAMLVGMFLLHPVWMVVLPALGWSAAPARPDLHTLIMATDMAVAMTVWMRYRGHRWPPIVEMDAAMYLPFVVLLVPFWTGAISGTTLNVAGHVLMLPAMLAVMRRRRAEYSAPTRGASGPPPDRHLADRPPHRGRRRGRRTS